MIDLAVSPPKLDWKDLLDEILPPQGLWTDEQYLILTRDTRRLVEFTDGLVELLPMPTDHHQAILGFLYRVFGDWMQPRGGKVRFAALRLRIRPGKFREPDLLLLLSASDPRGQNDFWTGADLVLEVVSPDDPKRDLIEKRADYAEAKIPEYWIVNPQTEIITVLHLNGDAYVETGVFRRSQSAAAVTLPGFMVDVAAVFNAK